MRHPRSKSRRRPGMFGGLNGPAGRALRSGRGSATARGSRISGRPRKPMGPRRARKKNQRLAHLKGPDPRRGHAFHNQQQRRIGREESIFFRTAQNEVRLLWLTARTSRGRQKERGTPLVCESAGRRNPKGNPYVFRSEQDFLLVLGVSRLHEPL